MAKPVYPTTHAENAERYLRIMEEIKDRLRLIELMKQTDLPFALAREICVLQLRHICELIAIGCLAAQGHLPGTKAIHGESNPTKIFKQIDRVWKDAFPVSCTVAYTDGRLSSVTANTRPNALTRKDAEAIWSKSGNFLHRLTVKKFFTAEVSEPDPWSPIDSQAAKIVELLTQHSITVREPKRLFVVTLAPNDGRAEAFSLDYGAAGFDLQTFSFEQTTPPTSQQSPEQTAKSPHGPRRW